MTPQTPRNSTVLPRFQQRQRVLDHLRRVVEDAVENVPDDEREDHDPKNEARKRFGIELTSSRMTVR